MSQVVGLDMVTGMGFIGLEPGRLYKIGQSPKLKDQTASGNPLLLNSAAAPFTSLTLYGWSKQDGTPSPDDPVPIVSAGSVMTTGAQLFDEKLWRGFNANGIVASWSEDEQCFLFNGILNSTSNMNYLYINLPGIKGDTYTVSTYYISGNIEIPENATAVAYFGESNEPDVKINWLSTPLSLSTQSVQKVLNNDYISCFWFYVDKGVVFDNYKVRVMLNAGDTHIPWEPYTGGQPAANPYEGEIDVTVGGGNLFEDYSIKIPVNPSTTYYVSSGTRSEAGRIDIGCYDETQQLVTSDGLVDIPTSIYLQSNGLYRLSSNSNLLGFPITTGENTKFLAFIIPSFQTDGFPNLMLNAGSTALPYEPYKPAQTLTAKTSGGLPGIPVTVSKLPEGMEPTYIDDSGQAWVCDEVDFERGVYVRRVWKKVFDGSERWTLYGTVNGHNGFNLYGALPEIMDRREGFSTQYEVGLTAGSADKIQIWLGVKNTYLYAAGVEQRDESLEDSGLSNWKAHLAAQPLEVMTYLTTATEEPLSPEELAQYASLHTYSPTTTVYNDTGVWMRVGYKAADE